MIGTDLIIAIVLIGIVLLTLLISKMGILPKKSLPYVIAALAAIIGISLWRESRMKGLREELEKREKELEEREKRLKDLKEKYKLSEKELEKAVTELEKHKAAYEQEILLLNAKNKEEKERIDQLSGEDLHSEFLSAFGN